MSVNPRDPGSSGSFTRVKAAAPQESGFGYRPLYRQVKDVLLKRLAEGSWAAGEILPSEPEIAAGLGVSPGTVRKALDELTAENLLVRRQGRGTFVARHDEERILFQFFRLISDTGERRFPESRVLAVLVKPAAADVAEALGLASGTPVTTIERVRSIDDVPCIHEFIALPAALFPGMEARSNLPNNLYAMFAADYGVTVARASERLKAIVAGVRQAELLETADGEALLAVDRLAFGLDGQPVEWRRSLCRTDRWHYASDLK